MTTLDLQSVDLTDLQRGLARRLARFRRAVKLHLAISGLARVFGVVLVLALLSFVIDYEFHLNNVVTRIIFLTVALVIAGYAVWRWLIRPLRDPLDMITLAVAIEAAQRESARNSQTTETRVPISQRVATVLQLPDLLEGGSPPSSAMVLAAVQRSHESLADIDFLQPLDRNRQRLHLAIILGLLLLPVCWAVIWPATAGLWARRWFAGSRQPWPQKTHLVIVGLEDGRIVVPRGEPYVLRVLNGQQSTSPDSVWIRVRGGDTPLVASTMTRFADGDFRHDFAPVQQEVEVQLGGGDDAPDSFMLFPVDRPRITHIELISKHPTNREPQTHTFSAGESDLAFLPRTKLTLTVTSNVPLSDARLKHATTQPAGLERVDPTHYRAEWIHEQPVALQIELISAQAGLSSLPVPIMIGLKADAVPKLTLTYNGVKSRVTPIAKIPLTVLARDDFGLADVQLVSRLTPPDATDVNAGTQTIEKIYGPVKPATQLEVQDQRVLELTPLKPAVGSLLTLLATASDERYIGAQTGQSRLVSFRIVSPEELFRDILIRQQGDRSRFRKALEEADKVREQLEALLSNDALDAIARQHRAVQRDAARVAVSMAETMTEMRLNGLGGPEAFDLMEKKILEPLRQLDAGLMTQQREALDAMLGNRDANKISQGLTSAITRQERIVVQMRDILKQMADWDSFVDVLNQLNEVIKLQNQVKQSTDAIRQKEVEGLFKDHPASRPASSTQPAPVPPGQK
ncbi:MAG: hypothetical protein IT444_00475 [Phycisphaeraceae bacterium]|nr:hypothetical protein [Phycisphaeraceae bacterium]